MSVSSDFSGARPTLKTIANLAGLSVASVSRALKNASDIGEDTKVRVRAIALQVGYRPNRAGVRLRTGRTNVIALVMSAESDVLNHTGRLIHSIAAGLRGTTYHMIVMPFFSDEDPIAPLRYIWETGSADGVIINQTTPKDPRVAFMTEHGMAFATHGRTDMGIEHPYYDYDNAEYSRLMVRALVARGRGNLALLSPPAHQSYGQHMISGFLDEVQKHGVRGRVIAGIDSDSSRQKIESVMTQVFASDDRPDGIVVGSSTSAMCTVAAGEATGLAIRKDFDVAAKEPIPILGLFRPGMIATYEDVGRAGDFLVRAVMSAIENREAPVMQGLDVPRIV